MENKLPEKINFLGKKIIVAEDEELNYFLLETILLRAGANVLHAWNGLQVIELLRKHPDVSIILMDIKMPVMDGYDATREVKKINPDIVVIAQTAYSFEADKTNCFEAGCDYYMAKPICKRQLYSIMEKYLTEQVK